MCGIFGVIAGKGTVYSYNFLSTCLKDLSRLSESRGKDSSGLCIYNQQNDSLEIVKGPVPVSRLFQENILKEKLKDSFVKNNTSRYAFGHARLVTNGSQLNDDNNQPVVKDGIIAIHNGIVANVDNLWQRYTKLEREYEIDTEVILALIRDNIKNKHSVELAVSEAINEVNGTVSLAAVFNDLDKFVLASNNGSLYVLSNNNDILFFASEKYMLEKFVERRNLERIGDYQTYHLSSGKGISIDLNQFSINSFKLSDSSEKREEKIISKERLIYTYCIKSKKEQKSVVTDLNYIHLHSSANAERTLLQYPVEKIKTLKRCTKCLLPETFPFIVFDSNGECNYCKNYKSKKHIHSAEDLKKLVEPFRTRKGEPDVLVPLSGGRDSTYVLHYVKNVLELNPVALTYDWGMVTDLARRNIARVCGKLGVENIIVAADIHWKRENIRKNISAWLKRPALGMIPLFMAGDKYFFYYAHKIKKQLGVDLEIWGVNDLENTNFKTGFAGLKPQFDKKRIYSLSLQNQLKLFGFVGRNLLLSPGYFNQSILDSLGSFASRYFTPKPNYYHFFDFINWDEKHIESTIINEYDWEKAVDTDSTWRIGDGTASFYNYIYTLVAGFSENDTFRSNQIREGMISREQALEAVYLENEPRYNSLKWYLDIIGLDYESVIKKINNIPRLF